MLKYDGIYLSVKIRQNEYEKHYHNRNELCMDFSALRFYEDGSVIYRCDYNVDMAKNETLVKISYGKKIEIGALKTFVKDWDICIESYKKGVHDMKGKYLHSLNKISFDLQSKEQKKTKIKSTYKGMVKEDSLILDSIFVDTNPSWWARCWNSMDKCPEFNIRYDYFKIW